MECQNRRVSIRSVFSRDGGPSTAISLSLSLMFYTTTPGVPFYLGFLLLLPRGPSPTLYPCKRYKPVSGLIPLLDSDTHRTPSLLNHRP